MILNKLPAIARTLSSKTVFMLSTAMTFTRPLLEKTICPYFEESYLMSSICYTAVVASEVVPVVVGTTYGITSIATQVSEKGAASLFSAYNSNLFKLVLPAGLGAINAQAYFRGNEVPALAFTLGTLKSTFEITIIGAISNTLGLTDLSSTFCIATTVSATTNTMYHAANSLVKGTANSAQETLSNAADYAVAFATARPLYQAGKYLGESELPILSYLCYFVAPVSRGIVLTLVEQGSVLVPGLNLGLSSNVLDGIAIASVSVGMQLSPGNAEYARIALLAGAVGYKIINNDDISNFVSNAIDGAEDAISYTFDTLLGNNTTHIEL